MPGIALITEDLALKNIHALVDFAFLLREISINSSVKSLQSCPTLYNSMDCSPPGSSIHAISQARILE